MTKSDLINRVTEKTETLSVTQIEMIVTTIFETIKDRLAVGEGLEIRGFGSFTVRAREARNGRNPKTGEIVFVPGKNVPFFKPGKELKNLSQFSEKEREQFFYFTDRIFFKTIRTRNFRHTKYPNKILLTKIFDEPRKASSGHSQTSPRNNNRAHTSRY